MCHFCDKLQEERRDQIAADEATQSIAAQQAISANPGADLMREAQKIQAQLSGVERAAEHNRILRGMLDDLRDKNQKLSRELNEALNATRTAEDFAVQMVKRFNK